MIIRKSLFITGVICTLSIFSARASYSEENEKYNKSFYNLLNPVPKDKMRDFSTDRPDKTESALTVDAGHFQLETDLITFSQDKVGNETTKSFTFNNMNLKLGITNNIDFQVVIPTYNMVNKQDGAKNFDSNGFGDITSRIKINLFGNDNGSIAMSMMPFIKIPTANNDLGNKAFEGGIIFPFSADLPLDFSFGLQLEADLSKNSDNNNYHPEFISSFTISHDIIGDLGAYAEIFSQNIFEEKLTWISTFDFGFTYMVTNDIQLDLGANIGITPSADDFNPFIGLSIRI